MFKFYHFKTQFQIKEAWASLQQWNFVDENAIIGRHPSHVNVLFACGASGRGSYDI